MAYQQHWKPNTGARPAGTAQRPAAKPPAPAPAQPARSALAPIETKSVPTFTPTNEEIEIIKNVVAKEANLSDLEFKFFLGVAMNSGLNPILRQIYVTRQGGKLVITTGIDGLRLIAQRTHKYRGQTAPEWCGLDGQWVDVWLKDVPPAAARVGAFHEDFRDQAGNFIPVWGIAKFESFAKWYEKKDREGNKTGTKELGETWAKSGDNQLAKCAEAQALRKAFPNETSKLFIREEIWDDETAARIAAQDAEAAAVTVKGKPSAPPPQAVEQAPVAPAPAVPAASAPEQSEAPVAGATTPAAPADPEPSQGPSFEELVADMKRMGWKDEDEKRKKFYAIMASGGVSQAADYVQQELDEWMRTAGQAGTGSTPSAAKTLGTI